jgi:hypothetical protein
MTTMHKLFLTVGLVLAGATSAHAQEVTRMQTQHAVTLDAGLDSAFITRVGYDYRSDALGPDSRIYARFTLPVVAPDLGDFALDAGARMHVLGSDGWGLQAQLGPVLRRADNRLFSSLSFGVRGGVLAGYQDARWGLLFELGVEQQITTQLSPSSLYKRTFYADAKSGWYAFTGGLLHAGLRSGVKLGRLEIFGTLGVASDLALQLAAAPFYLTLGTAYSL